MVVGRLIRCLVSPPPHDGYYTQTLGSRRATPVLTPPKQVRCSIKRSCQCVCCLFYVVLWPSSSFQAPPLWSDPATSTHMPGDFLTYWLMYHEIPASAFCPLCISLAVGLGLGGPRFSARLESWPHVLLPARLPGQEGLLLAIQQHTLLDQ